MDIQGNAHRSVRHRSTGLCRGCGKPTESRYGYCNRTRQCHAGQQRGRSAARRAGIGPVVLPTVPCESCGLPTSSRYGVCERAPACKAMHRRRQLGRPDPVTCKVCHKTETTPGIGICTLYPECRAARDAAIHPDLALRREQRAADLALEPAERRCSRCRTVRPLTAEHFPPDARRRAGFRESCHVCARAGVAASQKRAREWVQQYKESHPCADCGQFFPAPAMQFDHKPGHPKRNNISGMVSLRAIRAELEHVELVCAVCHTRRTMTRDRLDALVALDGPCDTCTALETARRGGDPAKLSADDAVVAVRRHKQLHPCEACGRRFPHWAMCFLHPRGGSGTEVGRLLRTATWARVAREIAGCELVCANCCAVKLYATRYGHPRRTVRNRAA